MAAVATILDFWSANFYILLIYKSVCCNNVTQMIQRLRSTRQKSIFKIAAVLAIHYENIPIQIYCEFHL